MAGTTYCSNCGTGVTEGQRFCPQCGTTVAAEGGAPVAGAPVGTPVVGAPVAGGPVAPGSPPPAKRGGGSPWGIVLALLLTVIAAGGIAAGVVALTKDSDSDSTSSATTIVTTSDSRSSDTTRSTATTRTTATTATTPTTVARAALAPVTAKVVRSCGASGNGDCFLTIRVQPSTSSAAVRRLDEGQQLQVVCQVLGESVSSSSLGRSTNVWERTPDNTYVSAAYVDAPGFDPLTISVPCP